MHVRITDKVVEAKDSVHGLEEYFNAAAIYFSAIGVNSLMNVFVVSDSQLVLDEAKQRLHHLLSRLHK